jgi:hypothetical protein
MVTSDQVDRALQYLSTTDLEVAEWKGATLRSEFMAKCAESLAYQQLEGGVEERKRAVILDEHVKKAWEEHFLSIVRHEALRAKRKRAELTIELYRTAEASRRVGNI